MGVGLGRQRRNLWWLDPAFPCGELAGGNRARDVQPAERVPALGTSRYSPEGGTALTCGAAFAAMAAASSAFAVMATDRLHSKCVAELCPVKCCYDVRVISTLRYHEPRSGSSNRRSREWPAAISGSVCR